MEINACSTLDCLPTIIFAQRANTNLVEYELVSDPPTIFRHLVLRFETYNCSCSGQRRVLDDEGRIWREGFRCSKQAWSFKGLGEKRCAFNNILCFWTYSSVCMTLNTILCIRINFLNIKPDMLSMFSEHQTRYAEHVFWTSNQICWACSCVF